MPDIMMYDISLDEKRVATQEDYDRLSCLVQRMMQKRWPEPPEEFHFDPQFRLAIYDNPARNDGVFVAEDKPIGPYDGLRGLNGQLLYPAVPNTQYVIRCQLPRDFANELVRRWNMVADNA